MQEGVDDDDPVLGVADDVDVLLGEQPDVEGVQHRTHRRHGEVRLEVLLVVEHEGRDALVAVDPEARAGRAPAGRPARPLGEGRRSWRPRRSTSTTVEAACTVEPYVRSRAIDSGTSCIVLFTDLLSGRVARHQSGAARIPLSVIGAEVTPSTWCSWIWLRSKPTREPAR